MVDIRNNTSSVDSFLAMVNSDAEVRSQFSSLQSSEDTCSFAASLGHTFTVQEYETKLNAMFDGIDSGVSSAARMSGLSSCPSSWPT